METTRHFTATVYVVSDGATLLHEHDRLGLWLPPGGHVDRDELPREAARREAREETGLDVTLLEPATDVRGEATVELPPPEHLLLHDIHRYDEGTVGHQHVDFVYFGRAEGRALSPADDEQDGEDWRWFAPDDLRAHPGLGEDVVSVGTEAIAAVASR